MLENGVPSTQVSNISDIIDNQSAQELGSLLQQRLPSSLHHSRKSLVSGGLFFNSFKVVCHKHFEKLKFALELVVHGANSGSQNNPMVLRSLLAQLFAIELCHKVSPSVSVTCKPASILVHKTSGKHFWGCCQREGLCVLGSFPPLWMELSGMAAGDQPK